MELSNRTQEIIGILFSGDEVTEAERLLEVRCSREVPGCRDWSQKSLERVWFSVLKISEGQLDKLQRAIELAHIDYRDLFMEAGFGHDAKAHLRWKP